MIDGNEELQKSQMIVKLFFARINHRLIRLYEIMQKNRHKVDMERQELQMLISDISHQVKTPVSNLQMVTDTLLTKPVSEEERMDFFYKAYAVRLINWIFCSKHWLKHPGWTPERYD